MQAPGPTTGEEAAESAPERASRRQRAIDYVLAAIVLAFAGWVYWMTQTQIPRGFRTDPLGPAAMPMFLAIFIAVLALGLVVTRTFGLRWLKPTSVGEDESFADAGAAFSARRLIGLAVLSGAYLLAMEPAGYVIASFLYGAAMLVVLGVRDPLRVLAPSALFVGALYAAFELGLKVPLPPGPFGG